MTTKDPIAKAPTSRPKRTPIGTKQRLSIKNKDANYEYRIVNDVRDRVEIFRENGWEPVRANDVKIGDSRLENPSALGTTARIPVGLVGENTGHGVVMRIPKDWYTEDQQAKQAEIDKLEATLKSDAQKQDGRIDIGR
jgi:hypothetical protein